MGRPSNTAERRLQIIEATVNVMARTGFDGASVQAIAKEAGLSAGLLHHHFSSKAAILHALPDHLEALVTVRYEALVAHRRGPWGRLEAWIDAHLATGVGAHPGAAAAWVWLGAQSLKDEVLRAHYQGVVGRRLEALTALLDEVVRAQSERVDAQALAVNTLATIEGYYQLAASTNVVPPGSAAGQLRRWLRRTLGGGRK